MGLVRVSFDPNYVGPEGFPVAFLANQSPGVGILQVGQLVIACEPESRAEWDAVVSRVTDRADELDDGFGYGRAVLMVDWDSGRDY